MGDLKSNVKSSFRTEMIATGLYAVLAEQCSKNNPALSERLRKVSQEEHMHGRLFRQYYNNSYSEEPGNEKIWISAGKFAGRMMTFMPMKKKLKSLRDKESAAVERIEAILKCGDETSFNTILRRILPDEVSHAAVYGENFQQ